MKSNKKTFIFYLENWIYICNYVCVCVLKYRQFVYFSFIELFILHCVLSLCLHVYVFICNVAIRVFETAGYNVAIGGEGKSSIKKTNNN